MFFVEGTLQSASFPVGMMGFAGMGQIGTADVVPTGTRLRLQANVENALGGDPLTVGEDTLEAIAAHMRAGGYRILKRWFSYSGGVSFEVELGIAKVNLGAIANSDFANSVRLGFQRWGLDLYPYNVRYDILFDPTIQTTEPPPRTVPPVTTTTPPPAGTPPANSPNDPNATKGLFGSFQDFFNKQFDFFGGAISGAALVMIGVGAFFVMNRD